MVGKKSTFGHGVFGINTKGAGVLGSACFLETGVLGEAPRAMVWLATAARGCGWRERHRYRCAWRQPTRCGCICPQQLRHWRHGYYTSDGLFVPTRHWRARLQHQRLASKYLDRKVYIRGPLSRNRQAKIDHPLDPANKYLYHSFVESPDEKNIYIIGCIRRGVEADRSFRLVWRTQ